MSLEIEKRGKIEIAIEDESRYRDHTYNGEKFPKAIGNNGPVEERSCTNLICCIIFIVYVIGMIIMVGISLPSSNLDKIDDLMDVSGNVCGQGNAADYPYLMMFKFSSPYLSTCVKSCPKFDYNQIKYNSTGSNSTYIQPLYFSNFSAFVNAQKKQDSDTTGTSPVVATGTTSSSTSGTTSSSETPAQTEAEEPQSVVFGYSESAASGYYTKQQWDSYLNNFKFDCLENEKIGACNHSPNEGRFLYDSRTILNVCFPISPRILARASILGDISGTFGDVGYSKWLIASSILISLAIAIVFMIVTALFITCAFWTVTLLAVLLGLIVGAISVLFAYSISYNQSLLSLFGDFTSRYSGQLLFLEGHITWVWVVGIILLLTTLLALILICIYRESISIELGVLDFTATFIFQTPSTVIVSILFFAIQVITLIACLISIMIIHTSGTASVKGGSPFFSFSYDMKKILKMAFFLLGTYWVVIFWNNFNDFVMSATSIRYYWKLEGKIMPAFCSAIFYHLGSIACPSLYLLPVSIFNTLFGWMYDIATDDKENFVQKAINWLCCFCCIPYEKLFVRMSERGFGMVYLCSIDFCSASKKDFYLRRRIEESIGSAEWISTLYTLGGRFVIALVPAVINWQIMTRVAYYKNNVQNPMIPTLISFIMSFIVGTVFMNMFSTVSESITSCYYIQLDTSTKISHEEFDQKIRIRNEKRGQGNTNARGNNYRTLN